MFQSFSPLSFPNEYLANRCGMLSKLNVLFTYLEKNSMFSIFFTGFGARGIVNNVKNCCLKCLSFVITKISPICSVEFQLT